MLTGTQNLRAAAPGCGRRSSGSPRTSTGHPRRESASSGWRSPCGRRPALHRAGEAVPAGTDLVTTGWGRPSSSIPTRTPRAPTGPRPGRRGRACETAYGARCSSTRCSARATWPTAAMDSCSATAVARSCGLVDGRWVQVGLVSWGDRLRARRQARRVLATVEPSPTGCATRPASARTAPSADAARNLFVDFNGRTPSADRARLAARTCSRRNRRGCGHVPRGRLADGRARRATSPASTAPTSDASATRPASRTGRVAVRAARRWPSVSSSFASSSEFASTYGDLEAEEFVELVYQNTLGRATRLAPGASTGPAASSRAPSPARAS